MSLVRRSEAVTASGFFVQAEDGIRDLVRSRGLGDVYKRQAPDEREIKFPRHTPLAFQNGEIGDKGVSREGKYGCLLYTSDAADERSSVDLGGRRIIKKKNE